MEITIDDLEEMLTECIQPKECMQLKEFKLTLTIKEASDLSGIGREKLTELTFTDDFPSFRVGVETLINRKMFIKWLDQITLERKQL